MLGVRLSTELSDRLSLVAEAQGRSKSEVARDAVRAYIDQHDEAFRAEARRQSRNAAARGWTEEDQYWESRAAFDNAEPPAQSNAAG